MPTIRNRRQAYAIGTAPDGSRISCRTSRCDHGTAIFLTGPTPFCGNVYPVPDGQTDGCDDRLRTINDWRGSCVEWRYVTSDGQFVLIRDRRAFAANYDDWPNIGTPGRERCR